MSGGGYLKTVSLQLVAAVANGFAQSQSVGAGAATILNGSLVANNIGVADVGRRVGITSAGNDSTNTFTITGTANNGKVISEKLTGANAGTAQSVNNYKTVTSIVPTNATAGAITAGTTSVASTDPAVVDYFSIAKSLGCTVVGDGATTYTIEMATDDLWPDYDIYNNPPSYTPVSEFTNSVSPLTYAEIPSPITLWRLTVTSGTGKITAKVAQALGSGMA